MAGQCVGWVIQPGQPQGARILFQGHTREAEQGAHQPTGTQLGHQWHGGQTLDPTPAEQCQQQGLGLVVLVVGRQEQVARGEQCGESSIAHRTGDRLQALPPSGLDRDAADGEWDGECFAVAPAVFTPAP